MLDKPGVQDVMQVLSVQKSNRNSTRSTVVLLCVNRITANTHDIPLAIVLSEMFLIVCYITVVNYGGLIVVVVCAICCTRYWSESNRFTLLLKLQYEHRS